MQIEEKLPQDVFFRAIQGDGSIGRAFGRLGWTVVSVDIDPKFTPTHVADTLEWDNILETTSLTCMGLSYVHALLSGENNKPAQRLTIR